MHEHNQNMYMSIMQGYLCPNMCIEIELPSNIDIDSSRKKTFYTSVSINLTLFFIIKFVEMTRGLNVYA